MRLHIICDDVVKDLRLRSCNALSILIELQSKYLLVNTCCSDVFQNNIRELRLDVDRVHDLVITALTSRFIEGLDNLDVERVYVPKDRSVIGVKCLEVLRSKVKNLHIINDTATIFNEKNINTYLLRIGNVRIGELVIIIQIDKKGLLISSPGLAYWLINFEELLVKYNVKSIIGGLGLTYINPYQLKYILNILTKHNITLYPLHGIGIDARKYLIENSFKVKDVGAGSILNITKLLNV